MSKQKPKTGMARMMQLAMTKKLLVIASVILSSLAAVASFIPYIAIYFIIRQILAVYPDLSALGQTSLFSYGWMALGGVAANIVLYFAALMCSHLAAFGTLYELKVNFLSHLAKVPLGFHVMIGSGKLRKITDENIENVEKFIAHQLPDIVAAFVSPVVMAVILLSVDWRLGLASIVGVIIAFIIQSIAYGREGAQKMMDEYQHSLENMNNAAVEYIRGISVVKVFKQTVYSFHRLHETIKEYTSISADYLQCDYDYGCLHHVCLLRLAYGARYFYFRAGCFPHYFCEQTDSGAAWEKACAGETGSLRTGSGIHRRN